MATIPFGDFPHAPEFNPSNNNIYLANLDADDVTVVKTATNTVVDTIPVGDFPRILEYSPGNNNIYVALSSIDKVSVIQTSSPEDEDMIGSGNNVNIQVQENTGSNVLGQSTSQDTNIVS